MDKETGCEVVSVRTEETSVNLNDSTNQYVNSSVSDEIATGDLSVESNIIGYSKISSGVINSQSSYSVCNNPESVIDNNSSKLTSVNNSGHKIESLTIDHGHDQLKRKRMQHDYKKLSKSGYVEDNSKWCTLSSNKHQSDVNSGSHGSVSLSLDELGDKHIDQDKNNSQGK